MVRPVHTTRVLQYIFLFLFIQSTRHLRTSIKNQHTHKHTTTHENKKENVKKTSQQIKKLHTTHTQGEKTQKQTVK